VRAGHRAQLRLRDRAIFAGSFNRRNLSYRVAAKEKPSSSWLRFLAERKGDSGIVYCQSRKSVESLAERLRADGFAARPVPRRLDDAERSRTRSASCATTCA
jgi:ATP-dependent DNA helicase RecQ